MSSVDLDLFLIESLTTNLVTDISRPDLNFANELGGLKMKKILIKSRSELDLDLRCGQSLVKY